ncbi:hypothetical protein NQ314_000525 [Rhamnusium bicolor]|uniref:Uncharacterized protein n=1 Tax=Rhamnusium bicolor TaxID=1586634 RepID=A0AAV8ZWW0_9CUCU|nr:hypothetical protein NQ314_000525 [Rhamnusium bicolor]
MSKRSRNVLTTDTGIKKARYEGILEELDRLREKILAENSEDERSVEDMSDREFPAEESERENREGETVAKEISEATKEYVALLEADPTAHANLPEDIHGELVVRWSTYLKKGLTKEQRADIMDKYPVPENCSSLKPPALNMEVNACLNEKTIRQDDKFLISLQEQIGCSLSALARPMNKLIESSHKEETKDTIAALGDASQLLCNVHHAISLSRKFHISPFLNQNCRKVMEGREIDEFLLGKNFFEEVKTNQAVLKAKNELKAQTQKALPRPSSSRPVPGTSRTYLNYRRPATFVRKREPNYMNPNQLKNSQQRRANISR